MLQLRLSCWLVWGWKKPSAPWVSPATPCPWPQSFPHTLCPWLQDSSWPGSFWPSLTSSLGTLASFSLCLNGGSPHLAVYLKCFPGEGLVTVRVSATVYLAVMSRWKPLVNALPPGLCWGTPSEKRQTHTSGGTSSQRNLSSFLSKPTFSLYD